MAGHLGGRQAGAGAGPGPGPPGPQDGPRPDSRTSFVIVSPGVSEGYQFVELRIGPSFTTPQNLSDMCIWVVRPSLSFPVVGLIRV